MARIKIELPSPQNQLFTSELYVRVDDLNYGGHLSNDRVLALAHEARVQYLKSLDQSEFHFFDASTGLIMSEAIINYKAESFQGDRLQTQLFLGDAASSYFEIYYLMTRQDHEVARIKTTMALFNYAEKKLLKTPHNLSSLLCQKN